MNTATFIPEIYNPALPVPGPTALWPTTWMSNALQFRRDPIGYMTYLQRTYGDVAALVAGGRQNMVHRDLSPMGGTYFSFGVESNSDFLNNHHDFHTRPVTFKANPTANLMSRGIFAVNGAAHIHARRLLMPSFHHQRLNSYLDEMVAATNQIIAGWPAESQRDIAAEMRALTTKIANRTIFGFSEPRVATKTTEMGWQWLKMATSLLRFIPFDLPGTPYRRFVQHSRQLDGMLRQIIAQKRQAPGRDIISMLIAAQDEQGHPLTEDELVGYCNILLIAAHDTTANALTWTLYLLAQHPHIYADVVDELTSTLYGHAPTIAQLRELPLLGRVVDESLRILPPTAVNIRVTARATSLGGYDVPPNAEVWFSPYITHHHPELWDQPESFNPDRWLTVQPSPYQYIPFGRGTRYCIGAPFALMEIKVVLAILLQRFRFQVVPQTRIDRLVIGPMSPKQGLPMIIHNQDRAFSHNAVPVKGQILEMVQLPQTLFTS